MRDNGSPDCAAEPPRADLVLRTPPNWVAVIFLGMMGGLHLLNAVSSLLAGRGAGYVSLAFGALLVGATLLAYHLRHEVAFLTAVRAVRLRSGVGRFGSRRYIPFDRVRGVRLTIEQGGRRPNAIVELLCPGEDVECPRSKIPRQQALYLAMLIDCPLIKVSAGEFDSDVETVADSPQPEPARMLG